MGEADLTFVDLGDVVTLEHLSAEVYDEERHKDYPLRGEKLNRPAVITLFDVQLNEKYL